MFCNDDKRLATKPSLPVGTQPNVLTMKLGQLNKNRK